MKRVTLKTKRLLLWSIGWVCLAGGATTALWAILSPPRLIEDVPARPLTSLNVTASADGATGLTLQAFEPLWALDLRRPLYDPPPVQAVDQVFVPPPFNARLMGTVVEPSQPEGTGLAMFATTQNTIEFKRVGEKIADAEVLSIREGAVTLRYFGQELPLVMEGQDQP